MREYASEELEDIVKIGSGKEKYIVTADPLDGSSLVDTNLAIGTIIGIHKESILDTGRKYNGSGSLYYLWSADYNGLFGRKGRA